MPQVDDGRLPAAHDIEQAGPLTRRGTAATSSSVWGASTRPCRRRRPRLHWNGRSPRQGRRSRARRSAR
jgi:hypothetical protein